ncbi:MAG: four helix bundle protein [Chloroflexota bacterium]
MPEQSFETLKVWQKAHAFMLDLHKRLLPLLPKEEKYGLADQIRRSSKSVGANIAEGSGRFYYLDNVRFCYQARGSLDETLNHLRTAHDLGYCPNDIYADFRKQMEEIRRALNGYIIWLKNQKIGEREPGANLHLKEISADYYTEPEDI